MDWQDHVLSNNINNNIIEHLSGVKCNINFIKNSVIETGGSELHNVCILRLTIKTKWLYFRCRPGAVPNERDAFNSVHHNNIAELFGDTVCVPVLWLWVEKISLYFTFRLVLHFSTYVLVISLYPLHFHSHLLLFGILSAYWQH